MNNDSTLTINLNEEYKIKIEEAKDFDTSIFKEVYETALKNVEEIVNQSSKKGKYDDFNNIIAFTGERGKGKSSSMISFRDVLVSSIENKKKWDTLKQSSVFNIKFAEIDIVDPSLFRGEERLFEIILAQMFQKFQLEIKKTDSNLSDDDRRNIIKHFQEVFENLQIINSDRKDLYKKDSIEVLSRLASSSNLRTCFKELVKVYLNKFEANKDFLIIAIDDFDLNISNTYEMLEDIRQFFIQSKIILLIACKMGQLKETITLYYESQKIKYDIENKSKRYIDKLFPFSRIIELPNFIINDSSNKISKIEIKYNNTLNTHEIKRDSKIKSLYHFLINELESRFNIYITNYSFRQNQIIPDTLREIINLLENIKDSDLENFNKYLISKIDSDLYSTIVNNSNYSKLLIFYQLLSDFIGEENDNFIINNPNHLLIGDFITIFEKFEKNTKITEIEKFKFLDFLKSLLSIYISNNKLYISNLFIHNGIESRLPKENNKVSRDWVKFNYDFKNIYQKKENDSIFLVVALIQIYGDADFKFRENKNHYFFKFFNSQFTQGILCPYAIFTNYLEIVNYVSNNENKYQLLFNDIELYNKKYNKDSKSFLKLLKDPSFAKDFLDGISDYAFNYKSKQPSYFELIYDYIYKGGIKSLENIQDKHLFIEDFTIESFKEFPLFKIWENELQVKNSEVQKFINEIYESSKQDSSKVKINEEINSIINIYFKRKLDSSKTLNNFYKKVKAVSTNHESLKLISKLRNEMKEYESFDSERKLRNLEEKNKKVNIFKNELNNIING